MCGIVSLFSSSLEKTLYCAIMYFACHGKVYTLVHFSPLGVGSIFIQFFSS